MVKLSISQAVPICKRGFESCFGQFFFYSPNFFLTASSYQIHVFNNLGYSMEGLEEADKVYVWDK